MIIYASWSWAYLILEWSFYAYISRVFLKSTFICNIQHFIDFWFVWDCREDYWRIYVSFWDESFNTCVGVLGLSYNLLKKEVKILARPFLCLNFESSLFTIFLWSLMIVCKSRADSPPSFYRWRNWSLETLFCLKSRKIEPRSSTCHQMCIM